MPWRLCRWCGLGLLWFWLSGAASRLLPFCVLRCAAVRAARQEVDLLLALDVRELIVADVDSAALEDSDGNATCGCPSKGEALSAMTTSSYRMALSSAALEPKVRNSRSRGSRSDPRLVPSGACRLIFVAVSSVLSSIRTPVNVALVSVARHEVQALAADVIVPDHDVLDGIVRYRFQVERRPADVVEVVPFDDGRHGRW
ncbi:MAG: hypothetical protein U5K30_02070 [Acidimicrobiales bacterium]|nr:hypothetical protein [Acidimicrobiales bacterium]